MNMIVLISQRRLHLQLQADQVGGLRTQQQIGVLGIALLHVDTDQQLIANGLDPQLLALPHHGEAAAGGLQLGAVVIFKNQLQRVAHKISGELDKADVTSDIRPVGQFSWKG